MFESLPISKSSKKTLAGAVSEPPAGSLYVFAAPGDLSFECAQAYTKAFTTGKTPADVTIAIPSGDRWLKDEVSEKIHTPSTRVSLGRPFVVVKDAHQMEQSLYDSLLKTIEEPDNGCVFVLCVPEESLLPQTYMSRASWVLNIGSLERQEAVTFLVTKGASKEQAAKAVDLCGDLLSLAQAACNDSALLEACSVLDASLYGKKPVSDAIKASEEIEALSLLYSKVSGLPEASTKSVSRLLCVRFLQSKEQQVSDLLRSDNPDIDALENRLTKVTEAKTMVWRYSRLDLALSHALI